MGAPVSPTRLVAEVAPASCSTETGGGGTCGVCRSAVRLDIANSAGGYPSISALKTAVVQAIARLPLAAVENAIDQFHRRMARCIKLKGRDFEWSLKYARLGDVPSVPDTPPGAE